MNRLVELASLAWSEAQRRSAAALADPSTHAALLWLLNLEWWQATLLVLAAFAAAIGTKVGRTMKRLALRLSASPPEMRP